MYVTLVSPLFPPILVPALRFVFFPCVCAIPNSRIVPSPPPLFLFPSPPAANAFTFNGNEDPKVSPRPLSPIFVDTNSKNRVAGYNVDPTTTGAAPQSGRNLSPFLRCACPRDAFYHTSPLTRHGPIVATLSHRSFQSLPRFIARFGSVVPAEGVGAHHGCPTRRVHRLGSHTNLPRARVAVCCGPLLRGREREWRGSGLGSHTNLPRVDRLLREREGERETGEARAPCPRVTTRGIGGY